MGSYLLQLLNSLDNALWCLALPALFFLGIFLSLKSRFIQFRQFPAIAKYFFRSLTKEEKKGEGVHPLKAFFACIGGCMGIGNIVAVCTAAQLGGPGALFWIWIAAMVGMILKYSEVYLGMRHRVSDGRGGFRGGPMYYLQKVCKSNWIPKTASVLLCIYGVEIYQFSVVTNNIAINVECDKYLIALVLIGLVIMVSRKGVQSVGRIASIGIPFFILSYLGMALWIIIQNFHEIPALAYLIIHSAFEGHAAVGAFAGSSLLLTMSHGIRRSCYAGDVAVGYASIIHSETSESKPENQASLAILEIFIDSFVICTTSLILVLITGVWNQPLDASMLVQQALSQYFPGMAIFMPLLLLVLGFTTIVAYFCAGIKCAEYLSPTFGRKIYYFYATIALMIFATQESSHALCVLSITAALLLLMNLYGIFRLRHDLGFYNEHSLVKKLI